MGIQQFFFFVLFLFVNPGVDDYNDLEFLSPFTA